MIAVDGKQPAPVDIGIGYPIIYDGVLYIPGGASRIYEPSTVWPLKK